MRPPRARAQAIPRLTITNGPNSAQSSASAYSSAIQSSAYPYVMSRPPVLGLPRAHFPARRPATPRSAVRVKRAVLRGP